MCLTIMNSLMIQCLDSENTDKLKALLDSVCHAACVVDCFENTTLHIAANRGLAEIVSILLAKGGDVKARNIHGDTPFISALKCGHLDVCKMLLEAGSVLEPLNIWGLTPLMYAVRNNHRDIVTFLLANSLCVNQTNKGGQTALFEACGGGLADCTSILLKAGAAPDIKDTHGQTPLVLAIRKGHAGCVRVLLKHGTNPCQTAHCLHARRWITITPMYAALLSGRLDVVEMLWSAMACTESDLFRFSQDPNFNKCPEVQTINEWILKCCHSPRSLVSLSHKTISVAVGYNSDRISRLKALGFPAVIQNKLLLLDI